MSDYFDHISVLQPSFGVPQMAGASASVGSGYDDDAARELDAYLDAHLREHGSSSFAAHSQWRSDASSNATQEASNLGLDYSFQFPLSIGHATADFDPYSYNDYDATHDSLEYAPTAASTSCIASTIDGVLGPTTSAWTSETFDDVDATSYQNLVNESEAASLVASQPISATLSRPPAQQDSKILVSTWIADQLAMSTEHLLSTYANIDLRAKHGLTFELWSAPEQAAWFALCKLSTRMAFPDFKTLLTHSPFQLARMYTLSTNQPKSPNSFFLFQSNLFARWEKAAPEGYLSSTSAAPLSPHQISARFWRALPSDHPVKAYWSRAAATVKGWCTAARGPSMSAPFERFLKKQVKSLGEGDKATLKGYVYEMKQRQSRRSTARKCERRKAKKADKENAGSGATAERSGMLPLGGSAVQESNSLKRKNRSNGMRERKRAKDGNNTPFEDTNDTPPSSSTVPLELATNPSFSTDNLVQEDGPNGLTEPYLSDSPTKHPSHFIFEDTREFTGPATITWVSNNPKDDPALQIHPTDPEPAIHYSFMDQLYGTHRAELVNPNKLGPNGEPIREWYSFGKEMDLEEEWALLQKMMVRPA